MICNKCNREVDNNSNFCQSCGNKIENTNFDTPNNSQLLEQLDNSQYISNIQDQNSEIMTVTANNTNIITYKVLSIISGIVGFGVLYFSGILAITCFMLGILFGSIYKSKTNDKCFGLTLNIIGLILYAISLVISSVLSYNTISEAKESFNNSSDYNESSLQEYEEQTNEHNNQKSSRYEVGDWMCKDKKLNSSKESENFTVAIDLNEDQTFKFVDLNDNSFALGYYGLGYLIKTEKVENRSVEYYSFTFLIKKTTKDNLLNSSYIFIKSSDEQFFLINNSDDSKIYSCYKQ